MNVNEQIQNQETKYRDIFINQNAKYFESLTPTEDIYEYYDLHGVRGNVTYIIEIKKRSERYTMNGYMYSTRMEDIKLNFFQEINHSNPNYELRYVNYYGDNDIDYISFNVSQRLKDKNSDIILQLKPVTMPHSTYGDNYETTKWCVDLAYNKNYGDVMVIAGKIQK